MGSPFRADSGTVNTTKKWPWWRKVEAERGVRGWSRIHIAREIDEPQRVVDKWLKGEASPRREFEVVKKLAALFGWPVAWLADEDEPYPLQIDTRTLESRLREADPRELELVQFIASNPEGARFLHVQMRAWLELNRTDL